MDDFGALHIWIIDNKYYLELEWSFFTEHDDIARTITIKRENISEPENAESESVDCSFNYNKCIYLPSSEMKKLIRYCDGESDQIEIPESSIKVCMCVKA